MSKRAGATWPFSFKLSIPINMKQTKMTSHNKFANLTPKKGDLVQLSATISPFGWTSYPHSVDGLCPLDEEDYWFTLGIFLYVGEVPLNFKMMFLNENSDDPPVAQELIYKDKVYYVFCTKKDLLRLVK